MHTNINLSDNNQYIYVVERNIDEGISSLYDYKYHISEKAKDKIFLFDSNSNIYREGNVWNTQPVGGDSEKFMPLYSHTSTITLYFPTFSIETYKNRALYALTLNTWVNGKQIVLGSYIVNRMDSFAANKVRKFYNNCYYECVEFTIIDPWYLTYSDEWSEFRKNVCGEKQLDDSYAINSVGSVLNISLCPIEKNLEGNYIEMMGYIGGQNAILLSDKPDDFLNITLKCNVNETLISNNYPAFICDLRFNDAYEKSIYDYIRETYHLDNFTIKYGLAIGNENELYGVFESGDLNDYQTRYEFKKHDLINEDGSYIFENGRGWKEGINVTASVDILNQNGESVLYLLSNSIPLTKEIFSYFVGSNDPANPHGYFIQCGYIINNIKLNDIDMQLYDINCVNKIEQKIIQLNKPENSKSNIMTPVFYSNQQLNDIIIHPEVTENICINLNRYKAKVDSFILQLEGCHFNEIGEINAGTLFKVVGNRLPNKKTSGVYYILDQNSEMITSGKYIYET